MSDPAVNPWKRTSIALMIALALVAGTGLVVANWSPPKPSPAQDQAAGTLPGKASSRPAAERRPAAPAPASSPSAVATASPRQSSEPPIQVSVLKDPAQDGSRPQAAAGTPSMADADACNRQAAARTAARDKTWDTVKEAAIGGAAAAALGAAAGAIADGGKGAGKGAAIGGIVGVAGGTLYGINENRKHDEAYRAAYQACMHARGFPG